MNLLHLGFKNSGLKCPLNLKIDTCAGDSGGPMLSNELSPLKRYSVIGITSFGVQCADANFPGVYTRVDNYLDWIAQNLQ